MGAFQWALEHPEISGPLNLVAPEPVRQAEFAARLGRALGRPAVVPTPAFALRLALGEMADARVLASARVRPRRLSATGFEYRHPELDSAIRAALGPG